jgi:hypothetical protein
VPEDEEAQLESNGREGENSPGLRGTNGGLQHSPTKTFKKNNFASTTKSPTKTARALKAQGKSKMDTT